MPLDKDMQAVLDLMSAGEQPSMQEMGVDRMRELMRSSIPTGKPEAVASVEDRELPGLGNPITVRVYTPAQAPIHPGLVYFHGGGWVLGDLDTHDATCRALARRAGCVVVAVDYRLAPEHKYPAGLDDCMAALQWVFDEAPNLHIDPERVAVAGDSAGGNLAAAVCLAHRERGGAPLCHQLLIYPVIDARTNTPSYRQNAEGYLLTAQGMRWFWDLYLNDPNEGDQPLASPIRAANLERLPPATIITAEFDPLRDEGEAYAEQLAAAGIPVDYRRYEGVAHGFFAMEGVVAKAKDAIDWAASRLAESFQPG